ncbi:hypothetical protein LCGC14_0269050 [marine sediment metagenome]|uniref:Tetratricopeptide repeat protein n=1 Tax=marine sediment metagenome TaxID=412755 RepID=A0A0F9WK37_9ZZZZ|nr:hypothetical protein [Phycisphaerae bacterium]HDZ44240.1 hypothetical protein [Phycisphaerae bacterium]
MIDRRFGGTAMVWAAACLIGAAVTATAFAQAIEPPAEPGALEDVLSPLSEDELLELIAQANVRRLEVEREQVIAEIRQGLLYDPQQIAEAVKLLREEQATTRLQGIRRIAKALALVDPRFARARELLAAGKNDQAVATAKKLLDAQQTTLLAAAKHLLYADGLRADGQAIEAAEAYHQMLKAMPERISFAATAAVRAGQTYDQAGRGLYAKQAYAFCLKNYGLAMTEDEVRLLMARVEQLEEIYANPLETVGEMMGQVTDKLEAADSGRATQAKQQEIILVLEDLIRTIEENQRQSDSQSQQRQRQKRQNEQSRGRQDQQRPSPGQRPSRPTSPLEVSRLIAGRLPEPTKRATVHDTDESGDWSTLPPRRREEIQQIMRRAMSSRYRRLVSDYHRRLAEQEE